jgi:hypothetical protein
MLIAAVSHLPSHVAVALEESVRVMVATRVVEKGFAAAEKSSFPLPFLEGAEESGSDGHPGIATCYSPTQAADDRTPDLGIGADGAWS